MAERSTDEIRQKMAVERQRLDEARDGLQASCARSSRSRSSPLRIVGIITARVGFRAGIGMVRKLS